MKIVIRKVLLTVACLGATMAALASPPPPAPPEPYPPPHAYPPPHPYPPPHAYPVPHGYPPAPVYPVYLTGELRQWCMYHSCRVSRDVAIKGCKVTTHIHACYRDRMGGNVCRDVVRHESRC